MATLQATTASNRPAIDPDAVEAVEGIIDDYDFLGAHDELTVAVAEPDGPEADVPVLTIHGDATFDASQPVIEELDGEATVVDRTYDHTEAFLTRLAPHLQDPLVVETVGHEKCRFPLLAGQWVVWPDGPVQYDSFDHVPGDSTDAAAEDSPD